MMLFLSLSFGVIGTFFIIGFGKLFEAPFWFIVLTSGLWGGFCGGVGRYIYDEMRRKK